MTQLSIDDLHVPAGGGEATASDMVIKARSVQLGGDFSIMEGVVRPGELLAPHTHQHEDQAVYIIQGELEFEIGGRGGLRFSAGPGSYVLKPRGISHGFWNVGEVEVRYIELSGRDGFEKFIDARQGGVRNMVQTARDELDMVTHVARIPELMLRHGLRGLAGVNMADVSLTELLPGFGGAR